jgi:3-oxoacyl-[acyl-carrier-protein] synthase II
VGKLLFRAGFWLTAERIPSGGDFLWLILLEGGGKGMKEQKIRVVVTGMGAITPLGHDVTSTWAGLCRGKSGVGLITLFDAAALQTQIAAEVKDFDPIAHFGQREARRYDRFIQFALIASEQAIADSGLTFDNGISERSGAIIGSGVGGIASVLEAAEVYATRGPRRVSPFLVPRMLADSAAGQVAITFGLRGPNMAVVTACATGTNAVGEAAEMIRRGWADVMVAGGSEAAITGVALAAFNVMGAISTDNESPTRASRPFDATRNGFVIGEGAGVLLLERLEHALARDARIYGEIVGYGSTADAFHMAAPAEDGRGAARAMRTALDNAGLSPAEIDYINAHGTSTPLNDKTETLAIKTVFGERASRLAISSTKSMLGHLLGAAGAVEAIICLKALNEGLIPPTINYRHPDPECDLDYVPNVARPASLQTVMSNSFGIGGHNAAIIFQKFGR